MHFNMKASLNFLAVLSVAARNSEASVANLLADRALSKLSDWIQSQGTNWMTLPGQFQQGQVHSVENKFILAFAGPRLSSVAALSRYGDAILEDSPESDPLYKSSQRLSFTATLDNVTVNYNKVAYTEDNLGSFAFSPTASTDGVTVSIVLDIEGDQETCVGFPNTINVDSNGQISVTVEDTRPGEQVPALKSAVSYHFKNYVIANIQTLLESGAFGSLENYDLCNGMYNPLTPANLMVERAMRILTPELKSNVSDLAWLPGFWKQFHAPNGTVTHFLRVDVGNFNSVGTLRRVGGATYYSNDNVTNPNLHTLNMAFEVDTLTAFYNSIYFTAENIQYDLAASIKTQKLLVSLSVKLYKSPHSQGAGCVRNSLKAKATYDGGQLQTEVHSSLPKEFLDIVISALNEGFLQSLNDAARDLFQSAGLNLLPALCPTTPEKLMPSANDMADEVLQAIADGLENNASKWAHLPGSSQKYYAPNGTLLYFIAAPSGNFSSVGSMERIDASYSLGFTSLNLLFAVDSMTAIYGNIIYSSNWVRYKLAEKVKTQNFKIALSITFDTPHDSGIITCYEGSVSTSVSYKGGDLDITNLTPGIPEDILSIVNKQLSQSFLHDVVGAMEDLYIAAATNALAQVCFHE